MKVQMLIHTGILNRKIVPGDIVETDNATGKKWIDGGMARFPRMTIPRAAKKPAKKVVISNVADRRDRQLSDAGSGVVIRDGELRVDISESGGVDGADER